MDLDLTTRLLHAHGERARGAGVAPAIEVASTFVSAGDPTSAPYAYTRQGNPTWGALEDALGALEDARALGFSSGQAAALALVLALSEERPRVLVPQDGYYGTRTLLEKLAPRGLEMRAMDHADLGSVERELARAPSVLWTETPTNPFLRVFDLCALAELAQRYSAPFVVDNTTATAALQRPLDCGASAVLTSLTKAASGHSDVVLGALTTRDAALFERLRTWRTVGGGIPGPFEAWLALRGLKTLPLRIERQSASALVLVEHLARHARVRAVHYPYARPEGALARRQMPRGGGPLLSFEVDGDAEAADRVVARATLIVPSTSFGGVESSWERRARWSGESAPPNLIRLAVGLEDPADLLADLERALS